MFMTLEPGQTTNNVFGVKCMAVLEGRAAHRPLTELTKVHLGPHNSRLPTVINLT